MPSSANAREWEDPLVNRIGTEAPRAVFFPCDSAAEVVSGRPSQWVRSLNGKWKFHWSADFDRRPENFFKPGFDDSKWPRIPVPGCWQMFGFGVPIYTNVRYPFDKDPPRIHRADGRPVGSYRHTFTIPAAWQGRRVFLRFDGVSSAFTAWLNGKKLGYAEDSRSPSEFDITRALRPGANLLSVEVLRWSDGSYLEDQDGWRMSGIFREVSLFATPAAHIRDFHAMTDFDESYENAVWKIRVTIRNLGKTPRDLVLGAELFRCDRSMTDHAPDKPIHLAPGQETTVETSTKIERPAPWSDESPNLHHTVLTLKNADGKVLEVVGCPTGFRDIEIRNRMLLVNGRPVRIRGVNRVEHDPQFGKTVPRETLLRDLRLMKRANINCIRTAHYPAHPDLYALCDAMGIYVIDEANVESHGIGYGPASLAKLPNWRKAHVERAVAMVHRDKNHPCVLLWSHGNEAGNGPNIVAMNEAVHSLDPTRPTHYQFAGRPVCCDTIGGWSRAPAKQQKWQRYLPLADLRRYAETNEPRPLILNEYCHAMGNAAGNLAEYQEVFDAHPSIAGGCIRDWSDQGLWKTAPFVGRYIAYGGDFGDHPNAGDFCLNGIVFADRTPTGKLAECRRVFQPVSFEMPDPRIFRIRNRHTFADTSRYEFVWQWCRDGEPKESGTLTAPPIAPGESALVPVPRFSVRSADGSGEWMVNLEARLRSPTPWAEPGYRVALGQFVLEPRNYQNAVAFPAKGPTPVPSLTPAEIVFLSKKEKIVFSQKTGYLNSWEYKGRQLVGAGPEPQFWRAPTSNDGPYPMPERPAKLNPKAKHAAQWVACGLDELKDELVSLDHELVAGKAIVTVKRRLASPDGQTVFDVTLVHTFDSKGGMLLETEITPSGRQPVSLPRAGLQFRLPRAFDHLEWFGRGPGESYPDRKSGMPLGRYAGNVEEQFVNYPVPRENGNKSDVRWLELKTDDGLGLLVTADRPINFAASRYETKDLAMARHTFDLRPHGYIVLHLDYAMGPLGNASCGNIPPLPKYLLKPEPMKWTMRFRVRED